ncbi:hypothetical protein SAMN04488029_2902 [Reichenbachiella faecimaris]|uniref:Uncharacterized protein n=1 Tax=Reichenbachiella faecimaris TaxID=692418 RepID=A0A1W2GIG8_REIFA|nr:DUF6134 family protein [Reichenbachiella faecimaris]SMD36453.1 hypothetical protein SAMN04488029_2902 [Reichenbachiella faecimaris]
MTGLSSPWYRSLSFIFLLSLLYANKSEAQRLEYDVIKGDKTVGYMLAEKKIKGDSVFYYIESETNIKMLLTFTVHYTLEELYVAGVLVSGSAESTLNGNSRTKSKVWMEGKEYVVEVNGYEEMRSSDPISYSVPELYFSEPGKKEETFSQQFAEYLIVKKDEEHLFTLYSEDGRNTHTYEDGVCTHVKLNRTYASFYFQLKQ